MFKKLLIFLILFTGIPGATFAADTDVPPGADTASASPDVVDFGLWNTPLNQTKVVNTLSGDAERLQSRFQENFTVRGDGIVMDKNFVPIEAKVGRAFVGAMSMVGEVLNRSLFGFVQIFLIILFAFWIMLEGYNLIQKGGDAKEVGLEIAKKGMWIAIWLLILNNDPAKLFMWIMSPIIAAGAHMSDIILSAVTNAAGADLPDTCAAIHNYMTQNPINSSIISSSMAADMLCVPTRLSGFFYTCVAVGLKWIWAGIGTSMLTFVAGIVFVVMFVYNIWQFALRTIGVIASMFIAVLLLPFTAIAETFGQWKTSATGPFAQIFGAFAGLFKDSQSLQKVMLKFIHATLYFIVLSIVAAIGLALLKGAGANLAAISDIQKSMFEEDSFMIVLITGALVGYLANKAGDLADKMGATLDKEGEEFAKKVGGDIKTTWNNTTKTAKAWWKAIRKK